MYNEISCTSSNLKIPKWQDGTRCDMLYKLTCILVMFLGEHLYCEISRIPREMGRVAKCEEVISGFIRVAVGVPN